MLIKKIDPYLRWFLKKRFLLPALLAAITLNSFSQNTGNDGYTSIYQSNSNVTLIPPAPTAASFQKFGITPVDLHNGVPNISIPIYEIKCGDISVPITLSYHNNGFKPQEKASWVGLGWNLSVGGCITRQQRGSPDNTRPAGQNFDDISPFDSATNTVNNRHKYFLAATYLNQWYDTEPDIFIYNFAGHQGKFMFIKGKPYFGDYERLKVVTNGNGFTITDDNGTQYVFTTFETSRPKNRTDSYLPTDGAVSAWYLTTIYSADGKHQVNFAYTNYTYHQGNTLTSETYMAGFAEAFFNYDCTTSGAGGFSSQFNMSGDNITQGKTLSQITTSDRQVIKFNQAASYRYDIGSPPPGESVERALQNIVVYGQTGNPDTVITKVAFAYDYFTNSTYPTSPVYARLKLRGMYNLSGTGDTLNNYAFGYENEFDNFPEFNTHATDAWGYYNGSTSEFSSTSLMPQIFFYTQGYNTMLGSVLKSTNNGPPYGNKEPNISYGKYGVLNKITYPTGGYTSFGYEQNTYSFYNPDNSNLTDAQRVKLYKDTAFAMTTFNTLNDPHNTYGTSRTVKVLTVDTVTTFYMTVSRTIWDSLSLPIKTFYNPIYIAKYIPAGCVTDDPLNPCDTVNVYTSPVKFIDSVVTLTDSVVLQPGMYRFTLLCDNKSFKTDLGVVYKIRLQSPALKGPGLRIASVNNYDGIQASPVSTKGYSYTDSLGKPSGVLNEDPRYQPLLTQGTRFAGQNNGSYCGSVDYLQYVFNSDNNAVYNANMNMLYYYYAVKEYTAPAQSNSYYSEHYYKPLLMPTPPYKVQYYTMPGGGGPIDYGKGINEDILLSSEPAEVKTITWRNKLNGTYQKQSETNTDYGFTIDKSVVGIRPISIKDDNATTAIEYTGWIFNKYTMFCLWKYPTQKQEISYDTIGTAMINTTTFAYNAQRQVARTEQTVNNGGKIITKVKYPADYGSMVDGTSIVNLAFSNVLSPAVETQIWRKNSSTDSGMVKGVVTDFDPVYFKPTKKYFMFNALPVNPLNNETKEASGGAFNRILSDTRYAEKLRMSYDKRANVMEVISDSNRNVPTSYVWGYYGTSPVAKVVGARFSSITAKIDTAAIQSITNDSLLRVALAPLRTITGAQATILTFAPYVGTTSVTDINGRTTYYEYDNFNRLLNIRDFNKNILKSYAYQYAGLNTLSGTVTPPTSVTITAQTPGFAGWTAVFTNTATSAVTTYTIPAAGGLLAPALPAGNYNITISKSGNTLSWIYSINCSSLTQTAVSASFSNVPISVSGCNTISIQGLD